VPARLIVSVLWIALCACAGTRRADGGAARGAAADAGAQSHPADSSDADHDGLCGETERDVGTDPNAADTDHDGLPDLVELGNGFRPVDANSPAADQIGILPARAGAGLDFALRVTVDGDGQGMSGFFEPVSSLYLDAVTAEDFLVGATAVAAEPVDGVRSINPEAGSFAAVLGKTRLEFRANFRYSGDPEVKGCSRTYPFRYSIKRDDGSPVAQRVYLLVVAPDAKDGGTAPHCLPRTCQ
jgi:hypothetical protein